MRSSSAFPKPDRKALQLSQRLWLRDRANSCGDTTEDKLAQCLTRVSLERQRFLEGRPETGPGSGGTLTPIFIQQAGRKGYYEIDVTALKYAPPTSSAERLFNGEIDKLLKQVPAGKNDEFGRDMIYSYSVHVRMVYASPHLISAHIETYQFSGGAHGNGGASNINIDVARGKLLTFADVFASPAKDKLNAECLRQILKEKAIRMPDEKIEGDDLKQLRSIDRRGYREARQLELFAARRGSSIMMPMLSGPMSKALIAAASRAIFCGPW